MQTQFDLIETTSLNETIARAATTAIANAPQSRPRRADRIALVACLGIALLSLWLRSGFPIHAIPSADQDDALFVRLAGQLGGGHWLGAFDNKTLVKGVFYPAFILLSFFAGVPLMFAEHIVYLAASYLAATLVRRAAGAHAAMSLALFAALAFNPVVWEGQVIRVIREGLYVGLSLAVVALAVRLTFPRPAPARRWYLSAFRWGVPSGFVLAAYWLTREEGVWLAPAIGAVIAVALGARALSGPGGRRRALAEGGVAWAVALVVAVGFVGLVATINRAKYGAFETTEVQSYSFRHAYGAISRIEPDHWRQYVVFPKDARERAYAVSPAARELAPFLDGATGDSWRRIGCAQQEVADCPEILSGWFQWAFRDAVASAGHYRSARTAAAYYDRLAAEIDAACDRNALPCLPPRATLAPPFRWFYVADMRRSLPVVAWFLFRFGAGDIRALPSEGPAFLVERFADMIGPVAPASTPRNFARGWVTARTPPTLRIRPHGETPPLAAIRILPAPDVSSAYPDDMTLRYELETECDLDACDLVVETAGQPAFAVPLRALVHGFALNTAPLRVWVDIGTDHGLNEVSERRRGMITRIAAWIGDAYGAVMPAGAALACLGIVLCAVWRRHAPVAAELLALTLASGIAVVTRVGLLAYLDATAIPSLNTLYVSPAAPFLIVFVTLGCCLGGRATYGWWRGRRVR